MKKLLTILVILVLAFAAIIFILKKQEEGRFGTAHQTMPKTTQTTQIDHGVADEETTSTTELLNIEAETAIEESLRHAMEETLKALIPDMGGLEKIIFLPPLIDAVENNKEIPDLVLEMIQDKNLDLGDAEGDTYKEQLNFYVDKYRDEILQWLKSQQ